MAFTPLRVPWKVRFPSTSVVMASALAMEHFAAGEVDAVFLQHPFQMPAAHIIGKIAQVSGIRPRPLSVNSRVELIAAGIHGLDKIIYVHGVKADGNRTNHEKNTFPFEFQFPVYHSMDTGEKAIKNQKKTAFFM